MNEITWKTKSGRSELTFHQKKVIIGLLRNSRWTGKGYGELRGKMFQFVPTGYKKGIDVKNIDGDQTLGHISIINGGENYSFQIDERLYTIKKTKQGWYISGPEEDEYGTISTTDMSLEKGQITYDYLPPEAILIAAYTINLSKVANWTYSNRN